MSSTARSKTPLTPAARNARLGIICGLIFFGMVGAAFAAVPLYRAFCQATGFGGTTQKAEANTTTTIDQTVQVTFDTNVGAGLPWEFVPEQRTQDVKLGETHLAYFKVTNTANVPTTGRAAYNVLPEQAGAYFSKIECFCFTDQTLKPGETLEFPVVFFIDPQFAKDFDTKDASAVTLSYTFYPSEGQKSGSQGG